jgi:hypothetical protein
MQHPDTNDAVRSFKAPKTGVIWITGKAAMVSTGGDGVVVSIKQNDKIIWGPKKIKGDDLVGISHDFYATVNEGDVIRYVVNKNGDRYFDTTDWCPTTTYIPSISALQGFSSTQGNNQWSYQQGTQAGVYSDMTWIPDSNWWKGDQQYCITGNSFQHPDAKDSVRKWVAQKDGVINIFGVAKRSSNEGDGVKISIKRNETLLYESGIIKGGEDKHSLTTKVSRGDAIYFIVNQNIENSYDTTAWNPNIYYLPSTNSVRDFGTEQGRKNWFYQQEDSAGVLSNMTYDNVIMQWKGTEEYCFVKKNSTHPENNNSIRKWLVPISGKLKVTGFFQRPSDQGDGVIVQIRKNEGTILKSISISDATKKDFSLDVTVAAGDEIVFSVNMGGNGMNDTTACEMNIEYQ